MKERKIGDVVSYGAFGECEIIDKRMMSPTGTVREYFILKRKDGSDATIYVPTDKADTFKDVRPVMSRSEVFALAEVQPLDIDWAGEDKARELQYRAYYDRTDPIEVTSLLKAILCRQTELKSKKRKLRNIDMQAIKICERILLDEIKRTMELRQEDIIPLITGTLAQSVAE